MTFAALVNKLVAFGNEVVVPLIIAIAGFAFLWGVVRYFFIDASDGEARAQGRAFMLWSILALAVIFSVWGLVRLLGSTIGIITA